jgi:hypothetical protein
VTPHDERESVLRACQAVCLLLGTEAMLRLNYSLSEADEAAASGHHAWLVSQRDLLRPLLEVLAREPKT